MPTRPSQGDVMQARWGSHGDHPVIVLAPHSVQEIYEQMVRAFNLSERLRVPVVVLYDEVIGHLRETVELADPGRLALVEREWESGPRETYLPYRTGADLVPAMARPGDGLRAHVTGLTHGEDGFPTQEPAAVARAIGRLLEKLVVHEDEIVAFEAAGEADAEVLVVAYGICARAARRALPIAGAEGVEAALFRPITLWPFPERAFRERAAAARAVLVPEMNAGQLLLEVERLCPHGVSVAGLNRIDGEPIPPADIARRIVDLAARR
jgi:2-oxoglutarate ferredoxin oxidoreductase subunit alpha